MSDRALDPRKAPRQKRAQVTVNAILEATAQLLVDVGYRKTSTNRIAERAGVSVGSLYQYFPNRESIVVALFEDLATKQMEIFEAGVRGILSLEQGPVPLDVAVRGLIHAIFATRTVEPVLSRILLEEVGWTEHVNLVGEWTARATALVAEALRHPDADIRAVDVFQRAAVERANDVQSRLVFQGFFTENKVASEEGASHSIFRPADNAGDHEPFSVRRCDRSFERSKVQSNVSDGLIHGALLPGTLATAVAMLRLLYECFRWGASVVAGLISLVDRSSGRGLVLFVECFHQIEVLFKN